MVSQAQILVQALSRGLEKDGVCKSAVIGVLAIHLVQREHQLSQLLRRPVPGSIHALSSSNGETIEVKLPANLGLHMFSLDLN